MPSRNVAVIGGGPAGLTAAIYLARAGLEPVVYLGLEQPGGALTTTTEVENYPGFPDGVTGPDLMENLQAQAERFGAELLYENVAALELAGETKTVTTDDADHQFDAVILSMGAAHKKLGLPFETELSGRGVSYCATCDGVFFKGQDIGVVGGGDSACEEALFLTRFGRSVTLFVRGTKLAASKIMADRVEAHPGIRVEMATKVTELQHTDGALTGIQTQNRYAGYTRQRDTTALFIAIGHTPRSHLVAGQVHTDIDGFILVDSPTTKTNLPGVFACGDLVDRIYRQAITAAGTGAAAGIDVERFLAER